MRRTRTAENRRRSRSREPSVQAESGGRRDGVGAVHRAAGNQQVKDQAQSEEGATQSADSDPTHIPADDAKLAVVRSLEHFGLSPPEGSGLTMADYVYVKRVSPRGSDEKTLHAFVRLGHDGNPLPSLDTIDRRRPEGGYPEHSLEPAVKYLTFEFHRYHSGVHTGFVGITEVESGTIEEQNWADTGSGIGGLALSVYRPLKDLPEDAITQPSTGRVPPEERAPTTEPEPSPETTGGGGARTQSGTGESATAGEEPPMRRYEVTEGDTLWDIAQREYGDGAKWRVLWNVKANREKIEDPDLIHPGQTILIPDEGTAASFDRSSFTDPPTYGLGRGTF